jgi:glucose dehydrogenase
VKPALAQGIYFLITGVWPLVSIGTFQRVTGPKNDLWLVRTVGLIIAVIGATLVVSGATGDIQPPVIVLAILSAAGLAGIDIFYSLKRVISPIYLGDAFLETCLILWWALDPAITQA